MMNEDAVEATAMSMWRLSEQLLATPMTYLAANLDTLVDIYNNLGDVIRLGNMGKHEEFKE